MGLVTVFAKMQQKLQLLSVCMQPSHSMGSEESGGAKLRRSSFLGRPLAELDNLW